MNVPCVKAVDNWWFCCKNGRVDKWMCCYLSCGMSFFAGVMINVYACFFHSIPTCKGHFNFYSLLFLVTSDDRSMIDLSADRCTCMRVSMTEDGIWMQVYYFTRSLLMNIFYFVGFWNKHCLIVSMYVDDSEGKPEVVFMGNAWSDDSLCQRVDCWNGSW